MDEAGNTGENLLDAAQPIYALAAVRVDKDARVLAGPALAVCRARCEREAIAPHVTRRGERTSGAVRRLFAALGQSESRLPYQGVRVAPVVGVGDFAHAGGLGRLEWRGAQAKERQGGAQVVGCGHEQDLGLG